MGQLAAIQDAELIGLIVLVSFATSWITVGLGLAPAHAPDATCLSARSTAFADGPSESRPLGRLGPERIGPRQLPGAGADAQQRFHPSYLALTMIVPFISGWMEQ